MVPMRRVHIFGRRGGRGIDAPRPRACRARFRIGVCRENQRLGWTLALVLWREAERGFEAWSCLRDIKTGSLLRVSISGPTALVSVLVTASVKAYACTP